MGYKSLYGKKDRMTYEDAMFVLSKSDLLTSLGSEENRALAFLIRELAESLSRELGALDSAQSEIAMLVEAAKETSSLIQSRISILLKVANWRGTNLLSLLQQCSSLPVPKQPEDRSPLAGEPQLAEAGEQLIEPQPWPADQG